MCIKKYKNGIKMNSMEGAKVLKAKGGVPKIEGIAVFSYSMLFNKMEEIIGEKKFITNNRGYFTKDIINVNFGYGLKEDEVGQLEIEQFKGKKKVSNEEIREYLYSNGFSVTYPKFKKGEKIGEETIKYRFWFRSSAKARVGEVLFINEKHYDKIMKWQSMGIWFTEGEQCKLVENMAYVGLTASAIQDYVNIDTDSILVISDLESATDREINKVIVDQDGNSKVVRGLGTVKNVLFDGQCLLDDSLFTNKAGMMLLRHHYFKACGFRTYISKFMQDYCKENNLDYETATVVDRYGNDIKIKNIKMITTENAMKWEKFYDNKSDGFKAWKVAVLEDGNMFGVVKVDHKSKMGDKQFTSYQMVNSLLTDKDETRTLFSTSKEYMNGLKEDSNFIEYLENSKSEVNGNQMILDLLNVNGDFIHTDLYRDFKTDTFSRIKDNLKNGNLLIFGDNLTVVGNPYLMLKASVGERELVDEALPLSEDFVSVYTKRFNDNEELGAFRNPHNSPNNIMCFKNFKNELMERYFNFSENIMAVNCIDTDIQDRANGCDFDSDFLFVTNNDLIVDKAKQYYKEFPTIVNAIPTTGKTYRNTLLDMARIDNSLSKGKGDIGVSSNLAQLCLSNYADTRDEEYLNRTIIMSVAAQIAIDNAKKQYEMNVTKECRRLAIKGKKPLFFKITQGELFENYMTEEESKEYKIAREKDYKDFTNDNGNKVLTTVKKRINDKKKASTKELMEKYKGTDTNKNVKVRAKIESEDNFNWSLNCPMNFLQYIVEEEVEYASRGKNTTTKTSLIYLLAEINKDENGKVLKAKKEQMDKIVGFVTEWDNLTRSHFSKKETVEQEENYIKEQLFLVKEIEEVISNKTITDKTMQMLIKNTLIDTDKMTNTNYIKLKLLTILHKCFRSQFLKMFVV